LITLLMGAKEKDYKFKTKWLDWCDCWTRWISY
jgi:hypothetical protein